jgi:hypothetical protein
VKNKGTSKLQEYHRLREEARRELLQQRKILKNQLKGEIAKFEKALEENASQLAELGYKVKESAVIPSGKNLRLRDDELKKQLGVLLAGKQLSIPSICQNLHIARTRFVAFEKKHKGFLGNSGKGRATVYFLKNAKKV